MSLLDELRHIMQEELPTLLADLQTPWQTLDVLYEEPRVERVWMQRGSQRLYLHRIHPCKKPFYHQHPWPCAVHILTGQYKMHIGHGRTYGPFIDQLDMQAGDSYQMVDQFDWHDVAPYNGPSLSLMLTGQPWVNTTLPPAKKNANKPLEPSTKQEIIQQVQKALRDLLH